MKICAVICEYNPFHLGHKYQFEKIKEKYDRILCIMSGNFTQRAEPAIVDKYVRAKEAVLNGADIVIQLPTVYACSAAPIFARGAINILRNLPIDAISFGMENDDLDLAFDIANCENLTACKNKLKDNLAKGNSYIQSYIQAIISTLKSKHNSVEEFLSTPNNMLAIEYIKAIKEYNLNWEIFPVKRENNYNSISTKGTFASATAVRDAIEKGNDISALVPDCETLAKAVKPNRNLFDMLALYALRTADSANLSSLSDSGEGLEIKLIKNASHSATLNEVLEQTKSKRYSFARIKRLTLNNLLSVTKEDVIYPDNATAIMLAVKNDFTKHLKDFSPYLITENSKLDNFIPINFTKIEERAEKVYSVICSSTYCGTIKKLVKV